MIVFQKGKQRFDKSGSGKTTSLCSITWEVKNPLVLSFTNKAIENVKYKLMNSKNKEAMTKEDVNDICHTFNLMLISVNGMVEI